MTFGSGANGCLGHGNHADVTQVKCRVVSWHFLMGRSRRRLSISGHFLKLRAVIATLGKDSNTGNKNNDNKLEQDLSFSNQPFSSPNLIFLFLMDPFYLWKRTDNNNSSAIGRYLKCAMLGVLKHTYIHAWKMYNCFTWYYLSLVVDNTALISAIVMDHEIMYLRGKINKVLFSLLKLEKFLPSQNGFLSVQTIFNSSGTSGQ